MRPALNAGMGSGHVTAAPLTADAFFADRQRVWGSFTSMTKAGAIAVAVLLVLMAIFLV